MREKDITRVNVGGFSVSIIGIKCLMEEMAGEYDVRSDEEIREVMMERLSKDNYIPGSAKGDYGRAFVREFRKFLGQPYEEDASTGLDIKVLGPGCPGCDQLEQVVMQLLSELQLTAGIEHVQDLREIAKYRVNATPVLVINGKVVSRGIVPSKEQIKKWLAEAVPGGGGT